MLSTAVEPAAAGSSKMGFAKFVDPSHDLDPAAYGTTAILSAVGTTLPLVNFHVKDGGVAESAITVKDWSELGNTMLDFGVGAELACANEVGALVVVSKSDTYSCTFE